MTASPSIAKTFADRIIPGYGLVHNAMRIAAANVLLLLCAQIALPLPWTPVPITGQTLGVMLVALLLGSRRGSLAVILYLLEGAAGLPVFQPFGAPGAARFFSPTAGYLLACPLAAFLIGWLLERSVRRSIFRLTTALLAGEVIILAAGCAWLAAQFGWGPGAAFRAGALPFLPGEAVKIALVLAAVRGTDLLPRRSM
jgi:biotin transport system substrate-specific component